MSSGTLASAPLSAKAVGLAVQPTRDRLNGETLCVFRKIPEAAGTAGSETGPEPGDDKLAGRLPPDFDVKCHETSLENDRRKRLCELRPSS